MLRRLAFASLAFVAACTSFAGTEDATVVGPDASDDGHAQEPDAASDAASPRDADAGSACARTPFNEGFDDVNTTPAARWTSSASMNGTLTFDSVLKKDGVASLEVALSASNADHFVFLTKSVDPTDCILHARFAFHPTTSSALSSIFSIIVDDAADDAGSSGAIILQTSGTKLFVFDQHVGKGYVPKDLGTLTAGAFKTISVDYDPKRTPQTTVTIEGGASIGFEGMRRHGVPREVRLGCVYAPAGSAADLRYDTFTTD